jgi:hypothetical protein
VRTTTSSGLSRPGNGRLRSGSTAEAAPAPHGNRLSTVRRVYLALPQPIKIAFALIDPARLDGPEPSSRSRVDLSTVGVPDGTGTKGVSGYEYMATRLGATSLPSAVGPRTGDDGEPSATGHGAFGYVVATREVDVAAVKP